MCPCSLLPGNWYTICVIKIQQFSVLLCDSDLKFYACLNSLFSLKSFIWNWTLGNYYYSSCASTHEVQSERECGKLCSINQRIKPQVQVQHHVLSDPFCHYRYCTHLSRNSFCPLLYTYRHIHFLCFSLDFLCSSWYLILYYKTLSITEYNFHIWK